MSEFRRPTPKDIRNALRAVTLSAAVTLGASGCGETSKTPIIRPTVESCDIVPETRKVELTTLIEHPERCEGINFFTQGEVTPSTPYDPDGRTLIRRNGELLEQRYYVLDLYVKGTTNGISTRITVEAPIGSPDKYPLPPPGKPEDAPVEVWVIGTIDKIDPNTKYPVLNAAQITAVPSPKKR